eukprot:g49916.t1
MEAYILITKQGKHENIYALLLLKFEQHRTVLWCSTRRRSRSLTSSNKRAEGSTYCSENSTYHTRSALNIFAVRKGACVLSFLLVVLHEIEICSVVRC